jgi:hypothetical protein
MEAPPRHPGDLQMRPLQIQLPCLTVSEDGVGTHRTPEEYKIHPPARTMHPPHGTFWDSPQRTHAAQARPLLQGDLRTITRQCPTAPVGAQEGQVSRGQMMMRQWDGVQANLLAVKMMAGGQAIPEAKMTT